MVECSVRSVCLTVMCTEPGTRLSRLKTGKWQCVVADKELLEAIQWLLDSNDMSTVSLQGQLSSDQVNFKCCQPPKLLPSYYSLQLVQALCRPT